jgi:hypothetical protein
MAVFSKLQSNRKRDELGCASNAAQPEHAAARFRSFQKSARGSRGARAVVNANRDSNPKPLRSPRPLLNI